jgi:hypothetical protein
MNFPTPKTNYKVVIIIFLASLILFGGFLKFLSKKSDIEEKLLLKGNFINYSFLNQTSKKTISTIPFYALEFNFFGKDSVKVNFGIEAANFKIEQYQGKIIIENAFQNKDIQILPADSSFIVLIDSAYTGIKESTVFKKVENKTESNFIFSKLLNKEFISGSYSLKEDSNKSKVTLYNDGKISGLMEFEKYELCVTGDCAVEVIDKLNLIALYTKTGSMLYYGLKKEWNRIEFYNLTPAKTDIKGERKITNLAFTLFKIK